MNKMFKKHIIHELKLGDYTDANTKMKYRCTCGNESIIIWNSFKKGTRCMKCSGNEKLTFEFVREYFLEQGCILLETDYINARKKMKYKCTCGNISNITWDNFQQGSRCNKCFNKTELKVYTYLLEIYKKIDTEIVFSWCLKKRFDFVISDLNLIIELDGCQHFQQVSNWSSPEETRQNDVYKMQSAYNNGFSMIRIQQDFVWKDKIDWRRMLNKYIQSYKTPTIIFIGDTRYQEHISDTIFTNNIVIHLI
jgi:hypothetical protein